jgi:hypothetical protein
MTLKIKGRTVGLAEKIGSVGNRNHRYFFRPCELCCEDDYRDKLECPAYIQTSCNYHMFIVDSVLTQLVGPMFWETLDNPSDKVSIICSYF